MSITALLQAAQTAQVAGRFADAARSLEQLLSQAPEQPQALNMLGVMALETSRPDDAAAFFARAIGSDPGAIPLRMNLAKAHRLRRDDAGERAALEGALAVDRTDFGALLRLAELHTRRGEDEEAVACWRGVIALAPHQPQLSPEIEAALIGARRLIDGRNRRLADRIGAGLHEERAGLATADTRRFDACVDHVLGRRDIYVNRCEGGIHFPFLPADEFFDRRLLAWLPELEAATGVIREEALRLLDEHDASFVPYVTQLDGTPPNKWSGLDRSTRWGAYFLWKNGERDDAACAACPRTADLVEELPLPRVPGRMPTIFFSLLRPRTRLPAHTGITNTRAIVHLPLVVPAGCGFRVGGEVREWREGEALAFDDTIEHEAWNESDEPRIVLILDTWNPHLEETEQRLLTRFFAIADESGQVASPGNTG